jgi:hypothetical protein
VKRPGRRLFDSKKVADDFSYFKIHGLITEVLPECQVKNSGFLKTGILIYNFVKMHLIRQGKYGRWHCHFFLKCVMESCDIKGFIFAGAGNNGGNQNRKR